MGGCGASRVDFGAVFSTPDAPILDGGVNKSNQRANFSLRLRRGPANPCDALGGLVVSSALLVDASAGR